MICSRDVSARWSCYSSRAPVVRLSREGCYKEVSEWFVALPDVRRPGRR